MHAWWSQIFDVTNVTPQASHNTDFSRIRLPILDGHSKLQRQTIISGAFEDAAVNQFLRQQCNNISGLVKIGASFDNTLKAGVSTTSASAGWVVSTVLELMSGIHFVFGGSVEGCALDAANVSSNRCSERFAGRCWGRSV